MKHLLSFVFVVCLLWQAQAQQSNPVALLNMNQQLPSELLKSRSVVIINTRAAGGGGQERWEAVAEELHKSLRTIGVDPVAYYELGNVLSGPDATTGFLKDFQLRQIQNVVFVNKQGGLTLTVAPLGKKGLVDPGASAWQAQGSSADEVVQSLYKAASSASLHLSNFLIPEGPELFYTTDNVTIKKRFFSYPLDIKFDKLAVPKYAMLKSGGADSLTAVKGIMQQYPYEWGLTEAGTPEETLRMKQGFPYVLLYLHTAQDNVRRFLSYAPDKDAPLELQSGPDPGMPVYKFYIRHIPTGDVYIGSSWDASTDWQTALASFVQGLRKDQAANLK